MKARVPLILVVALLAALLSPALAADRDDPGARGTGRSATAADGSRGSANRVEPGRVGPRRTLDELAGRAYGQYQPDGSYHWKRTFREPIPWEEYVAALEAEGSTSTGVFGLSEIAPANPGTVWSPTTIGTCVPPDDDYDGDSFTLTTNPPDTFPLRQGEYVADRAKVTAYFTSYIEADIAYKFVGSDITYHKIERVDDSALTITTTIKDTREFKKNFNGSFGLKLRFARGEKPTIGLDLGLGGSFSRDYTYTWTRDTIRRMHESYNDLYWQEQRQEITIGPNDGFVRGEATMFNLSDYAIDVNVSDVRIAVVAFSPFTGAKSVLGDVLVDDSFLLGFGEGNNSAATFIDLGNLNTLDMMNRLTEGWIFDMEMASYTAVDAATGTNLTAIISDVNQRTSRVSIHYGDATTRQYGQVSVFQPSDGCLTGEQLLREYVGDANVEFDHMIDGTMIVKRINHRENRHADRDFDTLTPQEQSEYGRWVVAFDYYTQPLTTFELDTTLLAPEDKVYFYYITAADFEEDDPPSDEQAALSVANDGTAPSSQLLLPISVGDEVKLTVDTDFEIHEAYSTYVDDIYNANCGVLYNATYYGHRVLYDSNLHNITIPDADWYGLQVDFGGQGWRSIQSVLDDPAAGATINSFRGFPYYDYELDFKVTEGMLGNYPTRNLQVRNNKPRQTFSIGFEGWNVAGQHVVCRWNVTAGFHHNNGGAETWYGLDDFDDDEDQFYAAANSGADFDDVNDRRFPYSPEHLDGVDNDGDGTIDESPLFCPPGLPSYASGTCVLDNRLGWYGIADTVNFDRRERFTDGSYSAWAPDGSGTNYTVTMPWEPEIEWVEIRSSFGSRSGINIVPHVDGGTPTTFSTEVDFEAEDGLLVHPMQVDTGDGATYIHVPIGTPPAAARADYLVDIPVAGTYQVWTRVYATGVSDDSFLVELFDPSGQPIDFGFGPTAHHRLEFSDPAYGYNGFDWTRVGHYNAYTTPPQVMVPIFYDLGPGLHTLRIRPRELGTRLDMLRVQRYCPDGDGDGWTTCAGDCNDNNSAVYPGHGEVCSTGYDDDCDGYVNEGCGGSGSMIYKKKEIEQQSIP